MEYKYNKRLFSFIEFMKILDLSTYSIVKHRKDLKLISKSFRSNIMLSVTEVNGCFYCSYYHTKIAYETGITEDELESLLSGNLKVVKKEEHIALLFAQHYADVDSKYDNDMYKRVIETYGEIKAKGILSTIRLIMMGNAYGIAANCFKLRLSFKRVKGSKLINELSILLGIAIFLPLLVIKNVFTKIRD